MSPPQPAQVASRSLLPAENTTTLPALPDELELRPVDGFPKWFGKHIAKLIFRSVSMEEQPQSSRWGPLSPIAGYFRRDRHVHPHVPLKTYALKVTGVAAPRSFSFSELNEMPQTERLCVQECAGNGNHLMGSAGLMGQARWRGPSLQSVLDACGGLGPATHFAFRGRDQIKLVKSGYHYGLSVKELAKAGAILAITMNAEPLSRRHGFPVRLVVPKIYSMSHVKWLCHIEGKTEAHQGVHNTFVFTNKRKVGNEWITEQARWIGLKSLITRCVRNKDSAGYTLHGWAWGGDTPIERVEITTDGGKTWVHTNLTTPSKYFENEQKMPNDHTYAAWSTFSFNWIPAGPGQYRIGARSFDANGTAQRMNEDPNIKGHFNQCRVKFRDVTVPR